MTTSVINSTFSFFLGCYICIWIRYVFVREYSYKYNCLYHIRILAIDLQVESDLEGIIIVLYLMN